MISVTRIIVCHRLALGILYIWFTVGKFPCNLGKFLIDHIRFLLVTHLWIQIENSHYLCVTVFSSKFPCYLNVIVPLMFGMVAVRTNVFPSQEPLPFHVRLKAVLQSCMMAGMR